jgi:hypothetical protein
MQYLVRLLAVVATFGIGNVVRAQEWPRYYIGAAVGSSHLGQASGVPEQFHDGLSEYPFHAGSPTSATGRKVVAGFRPVRVVGVEVQYVNLGSEKAIAESSGQIPDFSVYVTTRADAAMLAAVLFIPEPMPLFDVYGKLGVAKLDESFFIRARDLRLSSACQCRFQADEHESVARPYVGIGARFKILPEVGVSVEYETIDRDIGDSTTLLSLGVVWER